MPCKNVKEKYGIFFIWQYGTCFARSCACWLPSTRKWWRLFRVWRQNLARFVGFAGDGEEVDGVDGVDDVGVDGDSDVKSL